MNWKTIIITILTAILTFWLGWFLHDMKRFTDGIIADTKRADSLNKIHPELSTIIQDRLDSLMVSENINSRKENFQSKISGRFIKKDAMVTKDENCAGFDFINSTNVLWTNEIDCNDPETLKIRWLDNATFMTRSTERINEECPPRVGIYQVISFDGKTLILKDIWTGWNDFKDERTLFTMQEN